MLGVAAKKALVDRYNEIAMNYSDETADEMTRLQDEIDAQEPLGPRCPGRPGDGGARLSARRCGSGRRSPAVSGAASRSAGCSWSSPSCCSSTSRRTISTRKPRLWLEGHLRAYPGAVLLVTHDRYFLDNVTGWILELDRGRGIPYEGNYSAWLGQKQKRLQQEGREEEARQRALEREQRLDPGLAPGPPGEEQGAHPAL